MPAISPMCISTACWRASWCICGRSRRRFASSTPMPAPAATTCLRRSRAAAASGTTASSASGRRGRQHGPDALLAPYLDAVAALNPDGSLRTYPGSPLIAQHLLRPQDRLIACELEPRAAACARRGVARRRPRQGAGDRRLDRARRLCAAQGAPRPCPGRSAVRGRGRFHAPVRRARGRPPQMADRHLHAVVSDQGPRRARTRWRGGCRSLLCRRSCAASSPSVRRGRRPVWSAPG